MKKDADASALSPRELLRFVWTQLTSMRTALTLLFVAALAAIPGSLIPQRPVSPVQVTNFIEDNPTLGRAYDALGLFEVYTSPWFSAIYLLLLVSLLGCIIPRIGVYAKAVRAQPVQTPRNLGRLPAYAKIPARDDAIEAAEAHLKGRHFRVRRIDEPNATSLSAERGYLREAGNLVFHLSLVVLLIGVAIGVLFGYRGTSIVPVGGGFANTLSQYDELTSGAEFTDLDLDPFSVVIDDFVARFETGPVNTGQPLDFIAFARVTDRPGEPEREETITVNHPLEIGGAQVHLLGHGYAPRVTVHDGNGDVAFSGPVVFLPQDGSFTSNGVIKAPDARPDRLAFEGIFVPTAPVDSPMPQSLFPDPFNPELFLNAFHGPPREATGVPENVYSLNKDDLTQYLAEDGDLLRFRLKPGEEFALPDGRGTISFEGWQRWVRLQVSYTPGLPLALGSVLVGVAGLCLSLFIRPRRLWVRVRADGTAEVAGLDRAEGRTGLAESVGELGEAVLLTDPVLENDPGRSSGMAG
ncbi:MAG TPA: cytochrome c biogenesis protein ResB [Propionibacterium sp.]|jgi:cytochrome c biogenesis protein|nr:cytochrome c biogenesis protein ResB [Propionibacterium sp.]